MKLSNHAYGVFAYANSTKYTKHFAMHGGASDLSFVSNGMVVTHRPSGFAVCRSADATYVEAVLDYIATIDDTQVAEFNAEVVKWSKEGRDEKSFREGAAVTPFGKSITKFMKDYEARAAKALAKSVTKTKKALVLAERALEDLSGLKDSTTSERLRAAIVALKKAGDPLGAVLEKHEEALDAYNKEVRRSF